MSFTEYSLGLIKKSGGRMTKTKLAVIELLDTLAVPASPYTIVKEIKKLGKEIDVATVYRILESFIELHLVHKTERGFMRCQHFECENSNHCHHQFICNKCKKAFELHIEDRDFLESVNEKFQDLLINSHNFSFSGFCKGCQS